MSSMFTEEGIERVAVWLATLGTTVDGVWIQTTPDEARAKALWWSERLAGPTPKYGWSHMAIIVRQLGLTAPF